MNDVVLYDNEVRYGTSSETDLSFLLQGKVDLGSTLQSDSYFPQSAGVMDATLTAPVGVADESELEREFERLACLWLEETKYISSINDIISHPAHMRMIGMGPQVIPWILKRLAGNSELWFWALGFITGEDPITEDIRGNVQAMRRAWLNWGQKNGQI